jgi:hypothetical protein
VLVKVNNGRLCGGYCSIGWKSSGDYQHDNNSFVFSLDSLKKYNGSQEVHQGHVYWNSSYGPWFGYQSSLAFYPCPMNKANHGLSNINSSSLTVPSDSQGKSELTGMSGTFTCAELEVF